MYAHTYTCVHAQVSLVYEFFLCKEQKGKDTCTLN